MARRTAIVRVAKWAARMQQEALSPIMQRRLATATVRYEIAAQRSEQIEDAVKALLNSEVAPGPLPAPVSILEVPYYLAFARQVAKAKDCFSGDTLVNEVALLVAQWADRGLDDDVLDAVKGVV